MSIGETPPILLTRPIFSCATLAHNAMQNEPAHGSDQTELTNIAIMGSMFLQHTEEEKELLKRQCKNTNVQKFLDELVIFSVAEPTDEARESPSQGSIKRRESTQTIESSPPKKQQQEEVLWKEALDPRSGRVYYYHVITRKTQWHKPDEIRAYEKRLKEEKKRQDRLFFKEMERNIYASLAKKEIIPGVKAECVRLPTTPAEETPSIPATKQRVRTISGMDEALLAQLKIGPVPVVHVDTSAVQRKQSSSASSTAPVDIRGRPPLPVRRVSSREASIAHSMSFSPEECDSKYSDVLERHDSDAGAELAGEKLLDAPINENVKLGGEGNAPLPKNHIRRNTGGTIYVKSTMTNPDIKATIKVR